MAGNGITLCHDSHTQQDCTPHFPKCQEAHKFEKAGGAGVRKKACEPVVKKLSPVMMAFVAGGCSCD